MISRSLVALFASLMSASCLVAQPPEPPSTQPIRLSRADLADVYLRFERALSKHPPRDATQINQEFDRATLQFFSGTFSDSAKMLCEASDGLKFGEAVTSNP